MHMVTKNGFHGPPLNNCCVCVCVCGGNIFLRWIRNFFFEVDQKFFWGGTEQTFLYTTYVFGKDIYFRETS